MVKVELTHSVRNADTMKRNLPELGFFPLALKRFDLDIFRNVTFELIRCGSRKNLCTANYVQLAGQIQEQIYFTGNVVITRGGEGPILHRKRAIDRRPCL